MPIHNRGGRSHSFLLKYPIPRPFPPSRHLSYSSSVAGAAASSCSSSVSLSSVGTLQKSSLPSPPKASERLWTSEGRGSALGRGGAGGVGGAQSGRLGDGNSQRMGEASGPTLGRGSSGGRGRGGSPRRGGSSGVIGRGDADWKMLRS